MAAERPEHLKKLLDWLNSLPPNVQSTLAEKMGTTIGQLRQIAYGNRKCNLRLAVEIDKYSGGAVPMTEMASSVDWDHIKLFIHAR